MTENPQTPDLTITPFAGAAAADGHVTMSWSGKATAGIAREGGSADVDGGGAEMIAALLDAYGSTADADDVADGIIDILGDGALGAGDYTIDDADEVAAGVRADLAAERLEADAALAYNMISAAQHAAIVKNLDAAATTMDELFGTSGTDTGDFDTYAEINATVVGSVAMDNGVTVSAAMSVDAGTGYDFADDDGFDGAKTNGVGFDWVKIDAGAAGTLTIDPDDIAHLVDGDDDGSADVLYTNDFGMASISIALDVDKDSDDAPVAEGWAFVDSTVAGADAGALVSYDIASFKTGTPTATVLAADVGGDNEDDEYLVYTPAVAADVQWSAKIEAPVADIATVYAAFDEAGGSIVGGSATVAGITITASSKLEALEKELGDERSNTIGASYTMGAISVGGSWNSIDDGNQWSINGSFSEGAVSVSASTNEGEEWEITGSYELSDNASLEAGVNYTEDAFVGVSFKF